MSALEVAFLILVFLIPFLGCLALMAWLADYLEGKTR